MSVQICGGGAVVNVYVGAGNKSVLKEGILTADGTEQLVVDAPGTLLLQGYVDLSKMVSGDEVRLARYVKVEEGGEYKLNDSETYSDAQEKPLIHFKGLCGYYGIKVTLQQTAGTYKTFPYLFMKET